MPLYVQKSPRTRAQQRGKAAIALSVIAALVAGGILAGASAPALAADGSVTGRVYRDFNSNGSFDSGNTPTSGIANDKGLGGVVATATDARGKVWTATTVADGTYSIPVEGSSGSAVRVEFTGVPAEYKPASHGTDNGTSVRFVSVGDSGVDYGVNAPDDFSQGNPPIATAIQYAGLSSSTGLASTPAIVAQPWSSNFDTDKNKQAGGTYPGRVVLATVPQVGSTWGSSFQASTGSIFSAATYKRHAGLGPLGLGGIYRVTGALNADGSLAPSGTSQVENWLDVSTLVNVGTVPADATPAANGGRGLGLPNSPAVDNDAFVNAGKVGIGSIAVSTDQKSLYFVNLFDKMIYQLDISNLAAPTVKSVIDLGLTAGQRPWALTVHRNQLFAGYVDSGEQAPVGSSAAAANMQLHVKSAPESAPTSWSTVLDGSLGYAKGDTLNGANVPDAQHPPVLRWNAWVDQWSGGWGSVSRTAWNSPVQDYPQPVLTDIDFDTDGYMNLTFADRTSIQGGNRNYSTTTGDTNYYQTVASGDLLVAAPTATGYELESNGKVGNRSAPKTASNNEGPGGGEFYNDRQALGTGGSHREVALGGLATLAGVDSVVATTYDPLNDVRVTGLNWFQPSTGAVIRGYQQIADAGDSPSPTAAGTFQKGGGLAVVQALAQLAPVEIGNRVWFDADQDGIQDADEPAFDGVTVELVNAAGTVIGTATTKNGGEYYFSTNDPDLKTAGFVPGSGNYTVRFIKPTTGNAFTDDPRFGTVTWSELRFTKPNQGDDDTIDSDAIPTEDNSSASIPIETIGAPGENDHTFDAGLVADATLSVVKRISADGGAAPAGATYTVNLAATDFRGDKLDVGANAAIVVDPTKDDKTVTLPVGSSATITEGTDATVKGYTVSPAGAVKVTGTRAAPTVITVTNTLFADGFFEVSKSVTGAASGSVSPDQPFTVSYTYPGLTAPKTLVVTPGSTAKSDAIPFGTVVTVSEAIPTGAPADVVWGTPIWTVDGGTAASGASTTLTIGDGSTVAVGLENPTTQLVNGFSVTKLVTGDAAGSVPDAFAYTVSYITPGQAAKPLTLTKADSVKTVTGLPLGTVVTMSEATPGDAAPDVKWGTPVFSGAGVTQNADGTASFTIGADAVQIVLTNPTERLFGLFSITKQVTGPAADTLTKDFTFTGTYLPAGETAPRAFSLTNGSTFTSPNIPAGTVVTLTENAPQGGLPALSGWDKPIFLVDGQPIGTDGPVTITVGVNSTLAVTLENPTIVTPNVSIVKGDVVNGVFHDADTMRDGEFYAPGETRQISITSTNTGTERLREVVLDDHTLSGAAIQSLVWTFPDGSTAAASVVDGALTARWDATFAPGAAEWMPGAKITGTATLTVANSDAAPHVDRATVDAKGSFSGISVTDNNVYNAYTAAIQVIKYDGSLADPAVKDAAGNWIVPTKPLVSAAQDANDADHAMVYEPGKAKHVRWVVTNTGNTSLTEINLADATLSGPNVTNWTSDLSAFGGPSSYSFVNDGTWHGTLPPGASFFSDGTLTLGIADSHADDVTVVVTPIIPEVDESGVPTGKPQLDRDKKPVLSRNPDGTPRTLTDHDPFHAVTPAGAVASALPNTGVDLGSALRVGLLALLTAIAGLGALLLVRRRRNDA